jgi:hypothetical protein
VRFELLGKEGVAVLRALGSEQPTGGGSSDPCRGVIEGRLNWRPPFMMITFDRAIGNAPLRKTGAMGRWIYDERSPTRRL